MSKIAGIGTYEQITPAFYRTFYPDDAETQAGSDGWSIAPVPGWGENWNLTGPSRRAVNGLGITPIQVGRSYGPVFVGTGADEATPSSKAPILLLGVFVLGLLALRQASA